MAHCQECTAPIYIHIYIYIHICTYIYIYIHIFSVTREQSAKHYMHGALPRVRDPKHVPTWGNAQSLNTRRNTIGVLLPCGCAWITFWKHSTSKPNYASMYVATRYKPKKTRLNVPWSVATYHNVSLCVAMCRYASTCIDMCFKPKTTRLN